jgi:hypothetical protein
MAGKPSEAAPAAPAIAVADARRKNLRRDFSSFGSFSDLPTAVSPDLSGRTAAVVRHVMPRAGTFGFQRICILGKHICKDNERLSVMASERGDCGKLGVARMRRSLDSACESRLVMY